MDNRYLAVLNELEPNGIDKEIDISDFIYSIFTNQSDLAYDKKLFIESTPEEYITRLLNVMHENKVIEKSWEENPIEGNPNRLRFKVRLTSIGLDYLYAQLLRQATLQSLKRQGWNNRITWGIAILAIIISTVASVWLGINNNSLDKRVYQLEQERKKAIDKPKGNYSPPKHNDTLQQSGG